MGEQTKETLMMRFPRWLSWVVLIGLGWLLYVGNTREQGQPLVPASDPVTAKEAPDTRAIQVLVDGERWKKALYPDYKSPNAACAPGQPVEGVSNYAIVLQAGSGDAIECTASAAFTITPRKDDGTAGKPLEATLTIGEQRMLDPLLIGMRPGEERLLVVVLPERVKALPSLAAKTQLLLNVKAH